MATLAALIPHVAEPQFQLLRDLASVILADGNVTDEERAIMARMLGRDNVSEEEIQEIASGGASDQLPATLRQTVSLPTPKARENYLVNMIQVMGADGESDPQEVYLLEIMAGKMGMNYSQLLSILMLHTTHRDFKGGKGQSVMDTFLKNAINPLGATDKRNRDIVSRILLAVAQNVPVADTPEEDAMLLEIALNKAVRVMLENHILVRQYERAALSLQRLLEEERDKILRQWTLQPR